MQYYLPGVAPVLQALAADKPVVQSLVAGERPCVHAADATTPF